MGTPPVWRQAIITIRPRRDPPLCSAEVFAPTRSSTRAILSNFALWQKTAPGLENRYRAGSRLANRSQRPTCLLVALRPLRFVRHSSPYEFQTRASEPKIQIRIGKLYTYAIFNVPSVKYFEIVSSVRFACIKGERLRIVYEMKQVQRE